MGRIGPLSYYDGSQSTNYFRRKIEQGDAYGIRLGEVQTPKDFDKAKGEIGTKSQADFYKTTFVADAIANHGWSSMEGIKLDFKDAVSSEFFRQFIPDAVEVIMRAEIEPQTPVSSMLFDVIDTYTGQTMIEIGAISGAIAVKEVAEASEYPTVNFSVDGGNAVRVTIKKYGLKFGLTMEAKELDQWGLLALFMRKIGNAFARKRESLCVDLMSLQGYTMYNNASPGNSLLGTTTGRGIDGAQNGTLSPEDLQWMYTWLSQRGFQPDTIIMNPLAWMLFATTPQLRELVISGNRLENITEYPNSGYAPGFGTRLGKLGPSTVAIGGSIENPVLGKIGAHTYGTQLNPFGATFRARPSFMPGPLNIILSPLVSYYQTSGGAYATNFIMCDSNNVGAIIRREAPTTEQWMENETEISWTKIRERYGACLYSQGRGIAIARNIILDKSYVFDNVNYQSLSPLTQSVAIPNIP